MIKIADGFYINFKGNEEGLIHYYFKICFKGEYFYYGNNQEELGGSGCVYDSNPKYFQITVYKDFKVPKWYKEGIIYQIFVDRFYNGNENGRVDNPKSNSFIYGRWDDKPMYIKDSSGNILRWDFFGGNLNGVIKKLPYLKALGVSIIYLNPIFESSSNHKYNTGDYKNIDAMFGNDKVFKRLCDKAHEIGIKIILDGVFSHTGADSIYFNKFNNYNEVGAYQSKSSKYYKWYRFSNYPNEYESWWGIKDLPNVDEMNSTYIDYIINDDNSVICKWMNLGADGWRLDVADELPDEFIEKIKKRIKELNYNSVLIGEVWEDASNKVSYGSRRRYLYGDELDSITNYPFKNSVIEFLNYEIPSKLFIRRMMSIYENYPQENFFSCMNILGNHDTERIFTVLLRENNDRKVAKKLLKLAIAIQMTFPGVPLIYYGDEAGVEGGNDPDNRRTFPWDNIDKEIIQHYKAMTYLRCKKDVFKKGNIVFRYISDDILCYERNLENEKILVIINRNKSEESVINYNIEGKTMIDTIINKITYINNNFVNIYVEPLSFKILEFSL